MDGAMEREREIMQALLVKPHHLNKMNEGGYFEGLKADLCEPYLFFFFFLSFRSIFFFSYLLAIPGTQIDF